MLPGYLPPLTFRPASTLIQTKYSASGSTSTKVSWRRNLKQPYAMLSKPMRSKMAIWQSRKWQLSFWKARAGYKNYVWEQIGGFKNAVTAAMQDDQAQPETEMLLILTGVDIEVDYSAGDFVGAGEEDATVAQPGQGSKFWTLCTRQKIHLLSMLQSFKKPWRKRKLIWKHKWVTYSNRRGRQTCLELQKAGSCQNIFRILKF